jgi:hypothetical protein
VLQNVLFYKEQITFFILAKNVYHEIFIFFYFFDTILAQTEYPKDYFSLLRHSYAAVVR